MIDDRKAALAEAADFWWDVAEVYEDEGADRDDHVDVLRRAFTSSHCDDFAEVLSRMTGWETARFSWAIPEWGFGHHTVVCAPGGKLVDATGWTDLAALSKRYGVKRGATWSLASAKPDPGLFPDAEDGSVDESMRLIAATIRSLPHKPFSDPVFRSVTAKPLAGADPMPAAPRP